MARGIGSLAPDGLAVIDASVAIKWVVSEPLADKAACLLDLPVRHAPAHYLAEACNAIWAMGHIRGELTQQQCADRVAGLCKIPVIEAPLAGLAAEAARLSAELGITVYDTLYLALALKLGAPLVTADRKLFERARGRAEIASLVVWLGDIAV